MYPVTKYEPESIPNKLTDKTNKVINGEDKGRLSRATLELIYFGVEKSNRRNSLFKAAKDTQQNRYSINWAKENLPVKLLASDFT